MIGAAHGRRRTLALGCFGALAALLSFVGPKPVQAAEPEPVELHQVVETALPQPEFSPSQAVGLRWARETQWSLLALTDPWALRDGLTPLSRGPLPGLERLDLRDDEWHATPYAATTVASAFAALATRGIPVLREVRDSQTIRTHRLGCYFKGRGGGLVWRLEF